jgi:hypothetical protein
VNYTFDDFLAGRIGIRCDTREQYDRLMQECEKRGIRWPSSRSATFASYDETNHAGKKRTKIAIRGNKLYYRCDYDQLDDCIEAVPFSIIFPATSTRKIVITTDGRVTTARLIDGKRTIKTATATCSPEDEFNFEYGAALACSRLTLSPKWAEWYKEKAAVLDELAMWLKGAVK